MGRPESFQSEDSGFFNVVAARVAIAIAPREGRGRLRLCDRGFTFRQGARVVVLMILVLIVACAEKREQKNKLETDHSKKPVDIL